MLNYKTAGSSELQIRSNPALKHVSNSSGFQKRISTLLEPNALPFPTFQIMKPQFQHIFESNTFYAWVRPAHLRPQWFILADTMPLVMWDQKNENRLWSLRIPFDKRKIQQIGPIVLEGAWDAQDHILWIWDVVYWEKANVWSVLPYSKRWELVKQVVGEILDCGHPMSDAQVCIPTWESLEAVSTRKELDSATSIDFQPEKPGQRKQIFLVPNTNITFKPTSHHERKMVAETVVPIKPTPVSAPPPLPAAPAPAPPLSVPSKPSTEPTTAYLSRDTFNKLPDTYRLKSVIGNEDLGLAAIRNLETSKKLRELIKTSNQILVDIQWFEPFQKYEIKRIHS
jgi:hypothetical protein